MVELGRDVRAGGVAAGRDHPDSRDERHARPERVDREWRGLRVDVPLVVAPVPRLVPDDPFPDPCLERGLGGAVPVDPQRSHLRVDEVVRTGGPDLGEPARVVACEKLEHLRPRVDLEDLASLARDAPTQQRQGGQQQGTPKLGLKRLANPGTERVAAGGALDRPRCSRDRLHRRSVGLGAGLPPRHEPVLCKQDEPGRRVLPDCCGDQLREREPGTDIVDPDGLVAEGFLGDAPAAGRGGQGDDRVRVRVIDVRRRDERVEERLDRRSRLRRIHTRAQEVVDHLGVRHSVALLERHEVVEPEPREALTFDRCQIAAAALHAEHPRRAARVVDLVELRRGVAATPVGDAPVGAQEVRPVHELVEPVEGVC